MVAFFRRSFLTLFAIFALGAFTTAQAAEPWQEGEHYSVLKQPIRVGSSDQVVVSEFFWYGCGHCYTFEPMVETWAKQLPEGVLFKPSPAMWNGAMKLHAKAYYIAETLGVVDTLHSAVFHAYHVERNRLGSEAALKELFVKNGVDPEDFDKAFNSFGVNSQVNQADARARSAKVSGTPSMMVNGKYTISASQAGGQSEMLEVAKFLVEKELASLAN